MPYPPQGSPSGLSGYKVSASNDLLASDDSEVGTYSGSYIELKGFWNFAIGTYRTYFELRATQELSGYTYTSYGVIGRNNTPVGTERSTTSTSFVGFTEDVGFWKVGERLQLMGKSSNAYYNQARVRNFRLYGIITPISGNKCLEQF
jgi:hypothetical protein